MKNYRIKVLDVYHYYNDIEALREALNECEDTDIVIEELVGSEYETARLYICQNCGGGFLEAEMDFDDDSDLCKDCNYQTFNEAPYGD